MKYIKGYKLFERKNNYKLFHKTDDLNSIINDGYIIGDPDNDKLW
jgi:hypothetical protein